MKIVERTKVRAGNSSFDFRSSSSLCSKFNTLIALRDVDFFSPSNNLLIYQVGWNLKDFVDKFNCLIPSTFNLLSIYFVGYWYRKIHRFLEAFFSKTVVYHLPKDLLIYNSTRNSYFSWSKTFPIRRSRKTELKRAKAADLWVPTVLARRSFFFFSFFNHQLTKSCLPQLGISIQSISEFIFMRKISPPWNSLNKYQQQNSERFMER